MDSEVLTRLQSFHLCDKEESGFQLETSDIQVSREECRLSLLGKIHGVKVANFTGVKNTFSSLWNSITPFKLRELGKNFFQFIFANQQDKLQILNTKAWIFEGQFLILKPWEEDPAFLQASLSKIYLWVQVWNLPAHWISKETELRFNNLFNNILDVLISDEENRKGRHIKHLAEIDLDKPLLRGTKLRFQDQVGWVSFEYEKMVTFCFYCGIVRHAEKNYVTRMTDVRNGNIRDG